MRVLRRATLLALVASACGSRHLSITLLQPASVSPDAGALDALNFSLTAAWDGGGAFVGPQAIGQGFSLDLPADVPLDVQVDGLAPGRPSWRGEWHGRVDSKASTDDLRILVLPVGFVSSFPSLTGLPLLAGSSATPLDSGRVLILGGIVGGGIQQSAWIYDQSAVAFSPAAPPARPRAHHLALSVGADRVLLAGGDSQETSLELYSPVDGGALVGSLSAPQLQPMGVALGTGGAVLGCGRPPDGGVSASIGVDEWPAGGTLAISCAGGGIAPSSVGSLIASPDGTVQSLAPDGSRAPLPRSATPRTNFGTASDGSGGVLIVGGLAGAGASRLVEDVSASSVQVGQLDTPRLDAAVVPFDGGYLVVGGIDASGTALASAQIIQQASLRSGGEVALSGPRHFAAVAQIPGYRLTLILSGQGTNGEPSGGLDVFAAP